MVNFPRYDAIKSVFSGEFFNDLQKITDAVASRSKENSFATTSSSAALAATPAASYTPSQEAQDARKATAGAGGYDDLTPEEQRVVDKMRQTDQEVRDHERMHLSVGGSLVTGGPTYSFETGPDGKRYAVGGEVSIDTSPARTPEATVPKAQHIQRTALAPPDPSPQDRNVAATAAAMEQRALQQIAAKASEQPEAADGKAGSAGRAGRAEHNTPTTGDAGAALYRQIAGGSQTSRQGGLVNAFA